MISLGVEISIAEGRGQMIRVLSLSRLFFFSSPSFSFVIMRYLFLGTKSLMQR